MSEFPNPNVPAVATFTDNYSHIQYKFPFNINSLNWNYNLNTQTYGTIGGRVTQILSAAITTMTIQGEAGNRGNLIQFFENFKKIQDNQNEFKVPATLTVPSRNLTFSVWLENFQMGWGPDTVLYPYVIMLEVHQDLNNVATNATMVNAVNRISQGVGFNPDWTGLSTTSQNYQFQDLQNALNNGSLLPRQPVPGGSNG